MQVHEVLNQLQGLGGWYIRVSQGFWKGCYTTKVVVVVGNQNYQPVRFFSIHTCLVWILIVVDNGVNFLNHRSVSVV